MNNGKSRASLLGIAGGYIAYLGLELFLKRNEDGSSMPPAVRILFIALFGICGIGLVIYAVRMWYKASKEGDEEEKKPREDENSLK